MKTRQDPIFLFLNFDTVLFWTPEKFANILQDEITPKKFEEREFTHFLSGIFVAATVIVA